MVAIQTKRDGVPDVCEPQFDFTVVEPVKNAAALWQATYTYLTRSSRLGIRFKGSNRNKNWH